MFLLETRPDDEYWRRGRREEETVHNITNLLFHEKGVRFAQYNRKLSRKTRAIFNPEECCDFNDPQFSKQWYFNNNRGLFAARLLLMNIEGVWKQGITGKGVVVTIVDDGVEKTHDDLKDNWDAEASYDFNNNDSDPTPSYGNPEGNFHGTRCAGQVAASANNSKCGVGAAFEASIGGIRMMDGVITDDTECQSLGYKRNYIDIYSMSWGPDDDGRTVDGPYGCTKTALKEGARKGRHGKGSIYVWASGNGGGAKDDCNLDGYISSIYTIAISAISSKHRPPNYSELCACTLASTYSYSQVRTDRMFTTDIHNTCTGEHTGTSAASPIAAGILALVLQANPALTWRDMQHIIVRTAHSQAIDRENQWTTNGARHRFHPKLGFGVLDATKMVHLARNWTTVAPHRRCAALTATNPNLAVRPQRSLRLRLTIYPKYCRGSGVFGDYLEKLEHVQLFLTISTPRTRGDVVVRLTSPSGTTSNLLSKRPYDRGGSRWNAGFKNWGFMSVHFWDEDPYGRWSLEITNVDHNQSNVLRPTKLKAFKLILWGTGGGSGETSGGHKTEDNSVTSSPFLGFTSSNTKPITGNI